MIICKSQNKSFSLQLQLPITLKCKSFKVKGGCRHSWKSVYHALCLLTFLKSRKFQSVCQEAKQR